MQAFLGVFIIQQTYIRPSSFRSSWEIK